MLQVPFITGGEYVSGYLYLCFGTRYVLSLLDGSSGYDQFYMSSLAIASSIGCLYVQLTSPLISGGTTMLKVMAREYVSIHSISLDGL